MTNKIRWNTADMPSSKKNGGTSKATDKIPAASNVTAGKGTASTRNKEFTWITPSKGGVSKVAVTKYAREHSIRYYIFNMHEDANAIGIVVYGERDVKLTSWLSKVTDDVIRKETGDFDPIPSFNGTFYLHDEEHNIVKNDRNQ